MSDQPPADAGFFGNPEMAENPYPFFAEMRANNPVAKFGPADFYGVTRYDDVVRILRDPATFSSEVGAPRVPRASSGRRRSCSTTRRSTRGCAACSRSAFTPRVIELQRPRDRRELPTHDRSTCSRRRRPTSSPARVSAAGDGDRGMLGVQDGDMATFKRWSDAIIENVAQRCSSRRRHALDEINREFDAYFSKQLDKLRAAPGGQPAERARSTRADEDGKLSQEDLLVICRVLLVAGNETTTGLIVNAARVFSKFPEVLRSAEGAPRADPVDDRGDAALLPAVPGDVPPRDARRRGARRDDPEGRPHARAASHRRTTTRTQFDRAEEFVVDRDPNRHLGFGMGIHYCLGAPLARLEAQIVMRTLLAAHQGDAHRAGIRAPCCVRAARRSCRCGSNSSAARRL